MAIIQQIGPGRGGMSFSMGEWVKMATTRHVDRVEAGTFGAFLYAPFLIRYLFIAS